MPAAASSPPFILDSDMSGTGLDQDPDFEFFDTSRAANSEGIFLSDDFPLDGSQFTSFGTPVPHKSPLPKSRTTLDTTIRHEPSAPSTASPGGSSQDSSSESGYKRKSSSESSRSMLSPGVLGMTDDMDMGDWKADGMTGARGSFGGYSDSMETSVMDGVFGTSDKAMDSMFDFASASSSPSAFEAGSASIRSPELAQVQQTTTKTRAAPSAKKAKYHSKTVSVCGFVLFLTTLLTRA